MGCLTEASVRARGTSSRVSFATASKEGRPRLEASRQRRAFLLLAVRALGYTRGPGPRASASVVGVNQIRADH